MTKSIILAFTGSAIKLFSFFEYKTGGLFLIYCIGHIIICAAIVIHLEIALLVNKFVFKDGYAILDIFGSSQFGLVFAILVAQAVYNDKDRYFTHTESSMIKTFILMCVQCLVFLILLVFKVIKGKKFEEVSVR